MKKGKTKTIKICYRRCNRERYVLVGILIRRHQGEDDLELLGGGALIREKCKQYNLTRKRIKKHADEYRTERTKKK